MLVALGSALAVAVLILLGATLIAAGWGSPYRYWIATGVILVMAAGAAGCLSSGLAKLPPSTHVQALKVEWQKDKAWLASRGDNEPAPGAAAAHAVKFPAAGRIADPGRAVPGSRNRSNPERV